MKFKLVIERPDKDDTDSNTEPTEHHPLRAIRNATLSRTTAVVEATKGAVKTYQEAKATAAQDLAEVDAVEDELRRQQKLMDEAEAFEAGAERAREDAGA